MIPADAPPPPPPADEMDTTFKLLFEAAESEKTTPSAPATETSGGKSLMQAIDNPEPPTDEKAKDEAKAKADKEAADKAAADKAAAEKAAPEPESRVKVKRKREREPEPTPAPTPTPPAPAPAPEAKKEADEFEAGLFEEEREQLELARYAEEKDPAKYKGHAAKMLKYLKDHAAYLEAHPKATDPESDEAAEYKAWVAKNGVTFSQREVVKLEAARAAEKVRSETTKEHESKLGELYDESFRRDQEPEIRKEAEGLFSALVKEALPEDLAKAVVDQGLEKAKAQYPLEFRVAGEVMQQVASDVEEYRRITKVNPRTGNPVRPWDPANPQHKRIVAFINEQCDRFKNGPKEGTGFTETPEQRAARIKMQTQDGKKFLTREEFFSLKPEQQAGYWTFNPDQIVAIYRFGAKQEIDARLEREHKQREMDGYVRKPAAPATPPATPPPTPEASSPPAPRPSPIPSNNGNNGEQKPERALSLLMGE